jgi:uncharacterized protein YegP (UPF0339 family)
MNGILMSVKERHEQINKHGFSVQNDKESYSKGQLLAAAMFFLTGNEDLWPIGWDRHSVRRYAKKTKVQRLVVAIALLMAEVDRQTGSTVALPDLQLRRAEYKKGPDQFYYVVLAKNGQVLSTSEQYTRRSSARRACHRLNDSIGSYLLITDATEKPIPFPKLEKNRAA